ncbi:WecB/TagA/CpsF family glycosyltransferase [Microbacteriaceae bacterium VKM Ac-2854]|nr:WecB/TagA/CpsF family glycosyltransferase [Microbacteriaceae bacterium VKM Ac-2854]
MTLLETRRILLGGAPVDLYERDEAVRLITERAAAADAAPLGVLSANVDHITHFGAGARWSHVLDRHDSVPRLAGVDAAVLLPDPGSPTGWTPDQPDAVDPAAVSRTALEWLNLIDGSPLASHARRLTGKAWPRLAGSDLIGPILDRADGLGLRVGVLGGSVAAQEQLRTHLAAERPELHLVGLWSPSRDELTREAFNVGLAAEIAAAGVELLIVGFGKPRQELWINEYGTATGARVLLAFGAAVDFLGGSVRRAPVWVAEHGLEWAWRLALEPRRLARRYLVEGPVAYGRLRAHSELDPTRREPVHGATVRRIRPAASSDRVAAFVRDPEQSAEVAVLIVTHQNRDTVDRLIESLRVEAASVRLRVIVVDNDSSDGTLTVVRRHEDVIAVASGGNRGYAGGINVARRLAGAGEAVLVLNPDLVVEPGAIGRMLDRLAESDAGVVVPLLRDGQGDVTPSLRWEPGRLNAIGDALFGAHFADRPAWLSEVDRAPESYRHAHPIEWATGAAVLVDAVVAARIGDWDERFFLYSEEVDFFRRARAIGAEIWFEPAAVVRHDGGGSGGPSALAELMAVNRVRYVRKHHRGVYAASYRAVVGFTELLRAPLPGAAGAAHRRALGAVGDARRWPALPAASIRTAPTLLSGDGVIAPRLASGSLVVPARNAAATIARTLAPFAEAAAAGQLEVVVVCHACTDATAELARGFAGVTVVEIDAAAKTAALNAGDAAATTWPRLYLDPDVEMPTSALWCVFSALSSGGLLAARADSAVDTSASSALVRSYYRARKRVPSLWSGLWGGGGYAVSEEGRRRFGAFPEVSIDDVFVHGRFTERERGVVGCAPVIQYAPRTAAQLRAELRANVRGGAELASILTEGGAAAAPTTLRTAREFLLSARTPVQCYDALVFSGFALLARIPARSPATTRRSRAEIGRGIDV